ncbi:hypothetical protein AB2M62_06255 [Sphingomonas sp. MMS12-HWE2-04]|uniref:hypothetical protein n=1 Tax=Sphingomonas sp. MMS12-HWE2-04 TaxID=3234199 RepID=UPI00384FB282
MRLAGGIPLDACATLGEEAAAKLVGSAVTSSELTTKVEGTDSSAAFSMCTFSYANGAKLALLTREAPSGDASTEAIEAARTSGGTMSPATDVPGLGKAAMWSDTLKGLQVFLDDKRYLSINFYGLPGGADGKAQAIAVAKKLL